MLIVGQSISCKISSDLTCVLLTKWAKIPTDTVQTLVEAVIATYESQLDLNALIIRSNLHYCRIFQKNHNTAKNWLFFPVFVSMFVSGCFCYWKVWSYSKVYTCMPHMFQSCRKRCSCTPVTMRRVAEWIERVSIQLGRLVGLRVATVSSQPCTCLHTSRTAALTGPHRGRDYTRGTVRQHTVSPLQTPCPLLMSDVGVGGLRG